jgi:predicted AAA+ superfamily ATPase
VGVAPSTANQWLSVLETSGQVALLEPWFSNRTKSLVKSPKLYLTDSGLLCALLNIRTPDELLRSPTAGAVWETFVFAQLRHRERMAGRARSLFFWRDRTREVDFVVDAAGRVELFEAKWTELPARTDAVNLSFVRQNIGRDAVDSASIVCRAPNGYPLGDGIDARTIESLRE